MQSLFQNVTGAAPSSVVTSNVWLATQSGTISASGCLIVKNALVVSSPASYVSGDSLSLRITASASENTAVVSTYQINGDSGTFSVATVNNTEYPYEFSLTDIAKVARNAPIDSNELTIYRLLAPVTVIVPSVFGATIIKNGVAVGQSTTVFNGDKVKLRLTTPSTPTYQVKVPLFVGSFYDEFIVTTSAIDQTPDRFTFISMTGGIGGTAYTSNLVTISGIDVGVTISATVSNGTLVKNGTDVGNSTTVVLGDTLRAKVVASALSLGAVCAVVTIGDLQVGFTVVSQELSDYYYTLAANKNNTIFDTVFTPNLSNNRLVKLDTGGVFTAYSFTAPTNTEDEADHIFLASYYEDALYVMSTAGATLRKVTLPVNSKPYACAYSPRVAVTSVVAKKYVSCSGTDSIVELDPTTGYSNSRTFTLPVGAKPMGIACDDTQLFSANYGLGTVTVVTLNTAIQSTINVGGTPFEIEIDSAESNAFWVSKFQENRVEKWVGSTLNKQIAVGNRPTDIAINSTAIFVCNSYDNTVSRIDKTTDQVTTYQVLSCPMYVAATDTYIYVGHFGTSKILRIKLSDGTTTVYADSGRHFGMGIDASGNIWIARLYNNAPAFVGAADRMNNVAAIAITDAVLSTVQSLSFTVTGTDDHAKPLVIPQFSGLQVRIDGQLTASPYVVNGSNVEIDLPSSAYYYDTISSSAFVNDAAVDFSIRTIPNLVPDTLYFTNVYNVEVGVTLLSNVVTIAGLTSGFSTTLLYENADGLMLINGVEKTAEEIVTNGDTVQLQSVVQGPYGTANTYLTKAQSVSVGSYKIVTMVLGGAVHGPAASEYEYVLDSAVKYAEPATFSEQQLVPEIQPFTVSLLPISADGSLPLYAQNLSEASAPLDVHNIAYLDALPAVSTFGEQTLYSSNALTDSLVGKDAVVDSDMGPPIFWSSRYAEPGMYASYFVALSVQLVPFALAEGVDWVTLNDHWIGSEFTTYAIDVTAVQQLFDVYAVSTTSVPTEFVINATLFNDVITDTVYQGRNTYLFEQGLEFHPNHNVWVVDPELISDVTYHFTFEMPMSYYCGASYPKESNLNVSSVYRVNSAIVSLASPMYGTGDIYAIDTARPLYKADAVHLIGRAGFKLNQPNQHLVSIVSAALAPYSVQGDNDDLDTCAERGGFNTSAEAISDCQLDGNSVCEAVLVNGCWTWKTPKNTNISCPVPPGTDIPLVGYISGG